MLSTQYSEPPGSDITQLTFKDELLAFRRFPHRNSKLDSYDGSFEKFAQLDDYVILEFLYDCDQYIRSSSLWLMDRNGPGEYLLTGEALTRLEGAVISAMKKFLHEDVTPGKLQLQQEMPDKPHFTNEEKFLFWRFPENTREAMWCLLHAGDDSVRLIMEVYTTRATFLHALRNGLVRVEPQQKLDVAIEIPHPIKSLGDKPAAIPATEKPRVNTARQQDELNTAVKVGLAIEEHDLNAAKPVRLKWKTSFRRGWRSLTKRSSLKTAPDKLWSGDDPGVEFPGVEKPYGDRMASRTGVG